ncbi:MAG: adenosylcobinamide-GDP ribazoletransferase [Lachnospiraceae bacterium]|nr:adenosylcobinamide-GDP ribazoletransferase [Lachnospiraceae bacterium]
MSVLKSFAIVFSMYSRVPMPQFAWKDKDMRYVMCFFPLVGAVQGGLFFLLCFLRRLPVLCGITDEVFAAAAAALPVFVTGGIHMDGFLDTVDARHSYGDRGKKLQILKDPHAGAFAILYGGLYLAFGFALAVQAMKTVGDAGGITDGTGGLPDWAGSALVAALIPVLSRALSAASLMWRKSAKHEGLVYTFASKAQKKTVRVVNFATVVAAAAAMILAAPFTGACSVAVAFLVYLYYIKMADREFGGITGDLAGYFLCICELLGFATAVLI